MGRPRAPAGLADKPNLRRVVIGAILAGTVVLLGSMGGAILAAPVVLPLLWWAARTTGRGIRVIGAILAALVVGEVAWAGVYVVVGERQPYIWALPALSGGRDPMADAGHHPTRPARARVAGTPRPVTAATAQPSRRPASEQQQPRASRSVSAEMTVQTASAIFSGLLGSSRNRPRTAMHLGGSIGLALGGSWPVTECWMVLGGIPAESSSAKRPSTSVRSSRAMMAVPSGDEDGHVGSPEQTLSHF